jgi:hypothetical protein
MKADAEVANGGVNGGVWWPYHYLGSLTGGEGPRRVPRLGQQQARVR